MGEKWIHEWIGIFIKDRGKRGQKRNRENSAWFVDREGNVGNWWKKSNGPNKNDTSKGWVTNIEIKITRRKIENEGRNKVNDSTV